MVFQFCRKIEAPGLESALRASSVLIVFSKLDCSLNSQLTHTLCHSSVVQEHDPRGGAGGHLGGGGREARGEGQADAQGDRQESIRQAR